MIQQHERLVLRLVVGDGVVDANNLVVESRFKTAAQAEVTAEQARPVHLALRRQNVVVAVPFGRGVEFFGRGKGQTAVGREVAAFRRLAADVVQTAGHQRACRPMLGKLAAERAVFKGRGQTVFGHKSEVDALVGQIVQVHAAIRHHREAQAGGVVKLRQMYALAASLVHGDLTDTGDLVDVADVFEKIDVHVVTSVLINDHTGCFVYVAAFQQPFDERWGAKRIPSPVGDGGIGGESLGRDVDAQSDT